VKRIGLLTLSICILTYGMSMQHASLQSYKVSQNCCCESNCDCPTTSSKTPIIRNIQCGDNGSPTGSLPGTQDSYITHHIIFKLKTPKLHVHKKTNHHTHIHNDTIDPPPPKKWQALS
jgi:hypothetical protein